MYKNIEGLLKSASDGKKKLYEIIKENEMRLTGISEEIFYQKIKAHYDVMKESAKKALSSPQSMTGNLISGMSGKQNKYAGNSKLLGGAINTIMAMALSCSEVNAGMGCICAAPTAGACGILPAVLIGVSNILGNTEEETLSALVTASGVGAIIAANATLSGAEGGCQAECGSAAAMAAAAAVFLAGGTNEQCANAVAFALINCMGLVCDPVAGLVQLPCAFRNASQAVGALVAAELALSGQTSVIPPDEVIAAMYRVGKRLPFELKETALGGIANTPRAKEIAEKLFKEPLHK